MTFSSQSFGICNIPRVIYRFANARPSIRRFSWTVWYERGGGGEGGWVLYVQKLEGHRIKRFFPGIIQYCTVLIY